MAKYHLENFTYELCFENFGPDASESPNLVTVREIDNQPSAFGRIKYITIQVNLRKEFEKNFVYLA